MEKKSQIWLAAFMMYLIAGLAGYIAQVSTYWVVFVLALIVTVFTLVSIFTEEKSLLKSTLFDWISICSFFALETALTICIAIAKVNNTVFGYFNIAIQGLALVFAIAAIIRYVIVTTKVDKLVKDKIAARKNNTTDASKEEIATKVEETIKEETTINDNVDTSDVEIVGQTEQEATKEDANPDVIGIELKEEKKEEETPYMEEEL